MAQPFGDAKLGLIEVGLIEVGLFAYALWRLQALLDTEEVGLDLKGIGTRLGFLISSVVHASLGAYCLDLLRNAAMSSGEAAAWRTDPSQAHFSVR